VFIKSSLLLHYKVKLDPGPGRYPGAQACDFFMIKENKKRMVPFSGDALGAKRQACIEGKI
jgi:hypothetical protein